MKIYISHSTNFDFKKKLYQPLKEGDIKCNFIFPHEKSKLQYPTKKLFSSKKCDFIIAEVSFPSTGQGMELGWADTFNIPIVCIYKQGSNYSKSLNLITGDFIKYKTSKDLIEKIKKIL